MVTFPEAIALVISSGTLIGLALLGTDVLRLAGRVRGTELGNEREDCDERILHSENTQLCERIDNLEKAVKMLAKALPHDTLTSWDESGNSTRECIAPPSSRPGATIAHALRPSSPPLPTFICRDGDNCTGCTMCLGML